MDSGRQVDVAYFDFKKAFDRVDTNILLQKLSLIGFVPKLVEFFKNYLYNRRQYVQIAEFKSEPFTTTSGVSQGSTLGPTLFLLMINNLPDVVRHAKCLMFADDLKLFLSIDSISDCNLLQQDINNVLDWGHNNSLEFNTSKCKILTLSRNRNNLIYNYHLSNILLDRVSLIRDLGLIIDTKLTFSDHINTICKEAHKLLGFVLRQSKRFTDPCILITLYNAYVRNKLEYNSVVWSPPHANYTLAIEKVQRKFARNLYKKIYGYYPYLYPSLFVSGMVGLETLQKRRDRATLIHYYLLLRNQVDNPNILSECGLAVRAPGKTVRSCRRLPFFYVANTRTKIAQNAPTLRALTLLNDLIAQHQQLDIFSISFREYMKYTL